MIVEEWLKLLMEEMDLGEKRKRKPGVRHHTRVQVHHVGEPLVPGHPLPISVRK